MFKKINAFAFICIAMISKMALPQLSNLQDDTATKEIFYDQFVEPTEATLGQRPSLGQCSLWSTTLFKIHFSNSLCHSHSEILNRKIQKSMSLDAAFKKASEAKPQLIIFGETHLAQYTALYGDLISHLKQQIPDLDCVFMELPPRDSLDILAVQKGIQVPIYDSRTIETGKKTNHGANTILAGPRLGVNIIPVDSAQRTGPNDWAWNTTPEGINTRNEEIAQNITNIIKSKACHRGLLIIGNGHVTDIFSKDEKKLGPLLTQHGVSNYAMNLVGFAWSSQDEYYWSACTENPKNVLVTSAFENKDIPHDLPMLGDSDSPGHWDDFNMTIVFPFMNENGN